MVHSISGGKKTQKHHNLRTKTKYSKHRYHSLYYSYSIAYLKVPDKSPSWKLRNKLALWESRHNIITQLVIKV